MKQLEVGSKDGRHDSTESPKGLDDIEGVMKSSII